MNNENKDHTHECKDCGWSGRDGQLLCAGKNKEKIPISQKTELYLCADCESVNVFEIGSEAVNEGVGVELKPTLSGVHDNISCALGNCREHCDCSCHRPEPPISDTRADSKAEVDDVIKDRDNQ